MKPDRPFNKSKKPARKSNRKAKTKKINLILKSIEVNR